MEACRFIRDRPAALRSLFRNAEAKANLGAIAEAQCIRGMVSKRSTRTLPNIFCGDGRPAITLLQRHPGPLPAVPEHIGIAGACCRLVGSFAKL